MKFAFWNKHEEDHNNSFSIQDYINKEINESYDKEKLIDYLNSGGIIAVSSKIIPHLFKDIERSGSFSL